MQQNKLLKFILIIVVIFILSMATIYMATEFYTQGHLYSSIEDIPYNNAGLVLGTSKLLKNGNANLFFKYRIHAAAELYKAGKIKYIIVSGDNSTIYYNEPIDMKEALIELGIPTRHIFLDYAGFRTFDSVIRVREIFDQEKVTIISQPFHNARAVFIARKNDIDAIAYNAQNVTRSGSFMTNIREVPARVKMFMDIYLLDQQPKFLGNKVSLDQLPE